MLSSGHRTKWICAFVFAAAVVACPALAQETGGSFGGGSFGGGDAPGGSSSSDYGSSSWSSRSSGGSSGTFSTGCAVTMAAGFGLILAAALVIERDARGRRNQRVDVTAITLALDWTVRARFQQALRELAVRHRLDTAAGRALVVRQTATLLLESQASWLCAGSRCTEPMSVRGAEAFFRQLAVDLRARFKRELIRRHEATLVQQDAPGLRARPDEGPGVVVVSLLVASRRELFDVTRPTDVAQIRHALSEIRDAAGHNQVLVFEVIWSPAADEDRMSTHELELFYPELRPVEGAPRLGSHACTHCRGVFPAELGTCPHCGAARAACS